MSGHLIVQRATLAGTFTADEGDIICACNAEQTEWMHAVSACFPPVHADITGDGIRVDASGLARLFLDETRTYRYERIGETTVRRFLLSDLSSQDEAIDPATVNRWRAHNLKPGGAEFQLFGSLGAEIWYGGSKSRGASELTAIWTGIEAATSLLRSEATDAWPNESRRHRLIVNVDDFDAATSTTLVEKRFRREVTNLTIESVSPGATANRWQVDVTGNFTTQVTHLRIDPRDEQNPLPAGQFPTRVHDTYGDVFPVVATIGPANRDAVVRGKSAPRMGGPEQAQAVTRTRTGHRRRRFDFRNHLSAADIAKIDANEHVFDATEYARAATVIDKGEG